jgi:predicted TIM-barrel fold metal-dependent hydrolase
MKTSNSTDSGNRKTNTSMNKIEGFDAHCHIFNLSFVLKEIKTMFFDWVIGKYPTAERALFATKEEQDKSKEEFRRKLFRMIELLSATVRHEKGNFKYLQSQANDAWGISIGAMPLMMDIYYILAPPVTKDDFDVLIPRSIDYRSVSIDEKEFEDEFAEGIKRFAKSLKEKNKGLPDFEDFSRELDRHVEESIEDNGYKYETRGIFDGNLKMTGGYRFHLDRLKRLVLEGEPIFPFLAADPRREGIFDALKDDTLIGKNGPFYGVKLYPRLGYHPASKQVQDILNICIERDLPVITHCGKSGFPPQDFSFDGSGVWKYNDFGNPEHFEAALKKGLRIDFAHLGSMDPTFGWARTIVSYMEKYENVYSDLSCYTGKEELQEVINLFGNNSTFKERIMYGSDFDVMSFTDKTISLEQYCRNFLDLFPAEIENMRKRNVLNFLNL